jgi:two-component sensor histidine kinase
MFSVAHGLQESDFQKGASHKDPQGRLYFGGSNGYNRFNPADIKDVAEPSEVILTDVNIAGERPTSRSTIRDIEEIELTAEDYFITFTFSVLDFLYPRGNQYRYKLVNFDPEWTESGTRNTATYTNLPAGSYTLRVQGANSQGIWNREGITVHLRVLPPWYLSWWAYCIYLLATAAMLALGVRYYRNSVHKQEYKLAAELSNNAAMRAVDELHDQIDYQDELVKAVYDHNVNTLDLVRQCIDIESNSRPELATRKATVNDKKRVAALKTFEDCLFYQNETLLADLNKFTDILLIQLTEQSAIDPETLVTINGVSPRKLPVGVASPLALILFELLENALTHAFHTSSPVNYLEIETNWPEKDGHPGDTMVLLVRDSGRGLPENANPKAIKSSGLAIVNHLVRELSGEISFDCRRGTSVTITIPDPLGDPW